MDPDETYECGAARASARLKASGVAKPGAIAAFNETMETLRNERASARKRRSGTTGGHVPSTPQQEIRPMKAPNHRSAASPPAPVASISRFAHLRMAADERAAAADRADTIEEKSQGQGLAARILAAGAAARGETFDPASMIDGPDQTTIHVTGDDLVRAQKQRTAQRGESR